MHPRTILVVDDSKLMRRMFEFMLHDEQVVTAPDGAEALERLAEDPQIDLILLDLHMPRMDGLEFLKVLACDPQRRTTPVVLVTTEGSEEEVARGMELGAAATIEKPFAVDELLALIDSLPGVG